ncbi:porin family protein [Pontibacter locisalis]|uniref:Porin family protein n=1 Tax=Pontibacter locisalis TaxID=1719035 RepID=A0ABW5IIL2_9BACT
MKKIIFLILLLLGSYAGQAQISDTTVQVADTTSASLFNSLFGVKAGLNFSSIYGDDEELLGNYSGHRSYHGGVFAQIGWKKRLAIRTELLYSRKGYERSDSVFRFDYLEVPILLVVNLNENIGFHLGPQINVMVSATEEGKEVRLMDYNTFDYGAAAGFEGRLNRFIAGARYNLSFENLIKQDDAGNTDLAVHPRVLQVYLGIGF